MAMNATLAAPEAGISTVAAAMQHRPWRSRAVLSRSLVTIDGFLDRAGFDRAPWIVVAFGTGIGLWFLLERPWEWLALIACCASAGALAIGIGRGEQGYPFIRQAIAIIALTIAAGCASVWAKSELVGAAPIFRPIVGEFQARVLERKSVPALQRVRLLVATREPGRGRAIRVRMNLPIEKAIPEIRENSILRFKARLMPPAGPSLPGGYNFARAAWFEGIAATGVVIGSVEVVSTGETGSWLSEAQTRLSAHVRSRLSGSPGAIAAAFVSGDRGAIADSDEEAMRDAGLTHLLSVSGLHVSAVVTAVYFLIIRSLAFWPWLTLRVRLPLIAATGGALAGLGYTLLTGAEVPTIRSFIGAFLVLVAMALGREPLSLRMVAVAAFVVLLFWPEAVVSPGFQMSFGAVIAIVALHSSAFAQRFFVSRDEAWWARTIRQLVMLLLTGVVIELVLAPIGFFHFHRSGIYGAAANVLAIPLTTFVSMPLIALALLLDVGGSGSPLWFLAGKSLELLLGLAHWTAGQPGAVAQLPPMGVGLFTLFISGNLWLALWTGRVRLLGLAPIVVGTLLLTTLRPPDILISGDGRHVGITSEERKLLVLRNGRNSYASDNLSEIAGMSGETRLLSEWPHTRCNRDFCAIDLNRGGRTWHLLISRGRDYVNEPDLAAACRQMDIVISDRRLPRSCQPLFLRADRAMLMRTGGITVDLGDQTIETVAQLEGEHGWWRTSKSRK